MGKYIVDIEQLYKGLHGLIGSLDQSPDVKQKVLDSGLILGMQYTNPEGYFVIDASGDDVVSYSGECPSDVVPKVTLHLTADTAHRYWSGKVNFMIAMQRGDIRTVGDMGAILKLVPVLGPLFKVYIDFLKNNGMADLIV